VDIKPRLDVLVMREREIFRCPLPGLGQAVVGCKPRTWMHCAIQEMECWLAGVMDSGDLLVVRAKQCVCGWDSKPYKGGCRGSGVSWGAKNSLGYGGCIYYTPQGCCMLRFQRLFYGGQGVAYPSIGVKGCWLLAYLASISNGRECGGPNRHRLAALWG